MTMTLPIQGMWCLFTALCIILAINPRIINHVYNTILGRIFLLAIIIFLSLNNITLGLLITLCLIIILNKFGNFAEGMDVMGQQSITTPQTIGDDNATNPDTNSSKIQVQVNPTITPKMQTISNLKDKIAASVVGGNGVDVQSMQQTIMPVDSNKLPINNNNSTDNVQASSQGLLGTSTLTENFCSQCSTISH
jgi:hypothetical protein